MAIMINKKYLLLLLLKDEDKGCRNEKLVGIGSQAEAYFLSTGVGWKLRDTADSCFRRAAVLETEKSENKGNKNNSKTP